MTRAFKALIVEGDAVAGKLGRDQRLKRFALFGRDWRCGRANGNIRHAPQPMALVMGRASQ
jgi:hypothetical protein